MEITIGKEYEMKDGLNWSFTTRRDSKCYDGSGPAEVSVGPFKSPFSAIVGEILLVERFGVKPLIEYYYDGSREQKGNHIHLGFSRQTYDIARISIILFRKLYTLGNKFRNTAYHWAQVPPSTYAHAYRCIMWHGREYDAVTGNGRGRKRTVEIRLSEGLIASDLVAIALAMGTYQILIQKYNNDPIQVTKMLDAYYYDKVVTDTEYGINIAYGANALDGTYYEYIRDALCASGISIDDIVAQLEGEWRYLAEEGRRWINGEIRKSTMIKEIYEHVAQKASAKEIRSAISAVCKAFGWNTRGIRAMASALRVIDL